MSRFKITFKQFMLIVTLLGIIPNLLKEFGLAFTAFDNLQAWSITIWNILVMLGIGIKVDESAPIEPSAPIGQLSRKKWFK